MPRKDFKIGRKSKPSSLSEETKQVAFRSDFDEMSAYVKRTDIQPLERRFVMVYMQRFFAESLQYERVVEFSTPALDTYDRLRTFFLRWLVEAHEALGDVERAHELAQEEIRLFETEGVQQKLRICQGVGNHHLQLGAYRTAIEWFDKGWSIDCERDPSLPLIAIQQLRAYAYLDELDREEELRERIRVEREKVVEEAEEIRASHGPTYRGLERLTNLLIAGRRGNEERVEELEEEFEEDLGAWISPTDFMRMRTLEASTWARLWLKDDAGVQSRFETFRAFLLDRGAPIDRSVLIAAAAEKELALQLGAAEDIEKVRHSAILYQTSRLMQVSQPEFARWKELEADAASRLPADVRVAVA